MSEDGIRRNLGVVGEERPVIGRWQDYLPLVLFASWPFISFLAANLQTTGYTGRILLVWGAVLVICFLGHAALKLLFHQLSVIRISILIGGLTAWFFSFLSLAQVLARWEVGFGPTRLIIWLGIAIFVAVIALFSRPLRLISISVIAMAIGLSALPLGQIVINVLSPAQDEVVEAPAETLASTAVQRRPNVYWILLDGYLRADLLKQQTGLDIQPFIDQLQERDFQVGTLSTSNYTSTKYSISTTLSMDYYLPVDVELRPITWTTRFMGFNEVVRRFKSHGYSYVHVEPGSSNFDIRCSLVSIEDVCITGKSSERAWLTESEIGLLKLTPLYPVLRRLLRGTEIDLLQVPLIYPDEMFERLRDLSA